MSKLSSYHKQVLDFLLNEEPSPFSIQINLLNKCYQKCIGCRKYEWPDVELPSHYIIEIIDWLKEFNIANTIVFSGGEPLRYKKFNEVISHIDRFGVLTSGLFPRTLDLKEVVKRASFISVSIDGATKETYKLTRGVDSLDKVIKNVETLVDLKNKYNSSLRLRCNVTISNKNIHEITDILQLCDTLNIDCNFFPIHTWNELKIDNIEMVHRYISNAMSLEYDINTNIVRFVELLHRERPKTCIIPYIHFVIDADGDVLSCCRLLNDNGIYSKNNSLVLGNINEKNINDIWFSDKAKEIRRRLFVADEPECISCDRYNKINEDFYNWYHGDESIFL